MMVVVYTRVVPQLKAALDFRSHALGTAQPRLSHREMISANKTIVAAAIDHFRVAPKLCAGVAINHAEDLHDASSTCDSVRAAEPIRQAASYECNFKHNRMVSHLAASHLAAPTPLRRAQGRVVRAGGTDRQPQGRPARLCAKHQFFDAYG